MLNEDTYTLNSCCITFYTFEKLCCHRAWMHCMLHQLATLGEDWISLSCCKTLLPRAMHGVRMGRPEPRLELTHFVLIISQYHMPPWIHCPHCFERLKTSTKLSMPPKCTYCHFRIGEINMALTKISIAIKIHHT